MQDFTPFDLSRIAQDLQIRKTQVDNVVQLLDEGNTIPFITRYRKERTGGLNEEVLRQIHARVAYQRQLGERKQTILKSIEGQGKLTDGLRAAILSADTSKRLEDLYIPFKPKKRSLATVARERGLEALALAIWNRDPAVANLADSWTSFVNPEKELTTPEDVQAGVMHILAEFVAETSGVRAICRALLWETGKMCSSRSDKLPEGKGLEYKDYFEFSETLRQIPPHRILAINRGEKENALRTNFDFNAERLKNAAAKALAEHLLAASAIDPTATVPDLGAEQGERFAADSAYQTPHAKLLQAVLEDALGRLLLPSLEREIRRELAEEAEAHAVMVFGRNLRSLLLQPPLRSRRLLAIDPGFRSGCKLVAIDEHGTYLEDGVIFPHPTREREKKPPKEQPAASTPPTDSAPAPATDAAPSESPQPAAAEAAVPAVEASPPEITSEVSPHTEPPNVESSATAATDSPTPLPQKAAVPAPPAKREEAKAKLHDLVTRHNLGVIAIGNGTACRETEEFVSELIKEKLPDLSYVIVNEAGASVYSASTIGREEFPNHDATVRGTISIGRRLQDPLSELVKVDPQSVGVGLYQHDISPRHLKNSLEGIIESCVNQVGVNLNTASVPLLRHVAGFNQLVARDIVEYRKTNGPYRSREQILQVPNVGPARFVQAAGFLKVPEGDNPLDQTWVHPESYGVAARLLSDLGYGPDVLSDKARQEELRAKLKAVHVEETAIRLQVGVPTLRDMLDALARPGLDPRDELPPPVFKKGVLRIEDLQPGMELKGTVLNVVDFGAFVDIGLKDSGLVHISQMANRFIKSAYDVVAVSDVITVWVLSVDQERQRVSLTMIKPGSQRKPPEKKPYPPRQAGSEQTERPPRAQGRPGGRPQDQRGPRPQGRPGGPPQHRGQGYRRQGPPAQGHSAAQAVASGEDGSASARPAKAPPPPRKPRRREPPRPKLSQAALEGKTPLRTFAELGALFAAKQAGPTQAVSAQPQQGSPSQAVVDAPALTPAVSEPPAADQTPPAEIPTPAESGVSAP